MDCATTFNSFSCFFTAHKDMLAILGALIGGGLALTRYWSDQAWKKKQFAYDYAERVLNDRKATAGLRMLDWGSGTIPEDIAKEYELLDEKRKWTAAEVATALRVHDRKAAGQVGDNFSRKEYVIRELFDVCLAHFERLGHFMKSGVISKGDFPTTLAYYAQIMREPRLAPIREPLFKYMERYGFGNACYVFEKLGAPEPPRKEAIHAA